MNSRALKLALRTTGALQCSFIVPFLNHVVSEIHSLIWWCAYFIMLWLANLCQCPMLDTTWVHRMGHKWQDPYPYWNSNAHSALEETVKVWSFSFFFILFIIRLLSFFAFRFWSTSLLLWPSNGNALEDSHTRLRKLRTSFGCHWILVVAFSWHGSLYL